MRVYRRRDWLIALLLALFMAVLTCSQVTRGMPEWGDDWAAYISEGISIADGSFREQARRNYVMHPSQLTKEAADGELVYVWGYPLVLSAVYQIVGFDTVDYSDVIFYKMPSAIAVSLMIGVLYLLYRRYFSAPVAVGMSLAFAISGNFFDAVESLYSDGLFIFCCVLLVWLSECWFAQYSEAGVRRIWKAAMALLIGVVFWMTYETRLNGQSMIAIIALSHGIRLCMKKMRFSWEQLIPYVTFVVLKLVSEQILLPATPNISDIGNTNLSNIMRNATYYASVTKDFFEGALPFPLSYLAPLLMLFFAIGFFTDGWTYRTVHFSLLIVFTYVVLLLLPYIQGLRYLYHVIPFLLLYTVYGVKWVWNRVPRLRTERCRKIAVCIASVLLLCAYIKPVAAGVENLRNDRPPSSTNVYSADSVEMYRYLQTETPEDAVIAFWKPRALYVNTNRISICPINNGHSVSEADYYLEYHLINSEATKAKYSQLLEENAECLVRVYGNDTYTLYQVTK